jgi:tetratricopeptide (TPR) repeat protein
VACAGTAIATGGDLPWPAIEALERAGELEAALARLPSASVALPQDALKAARTRQRLLDRLGRYGAAAQAGEDWAGLAARLAQPEEEIEALRLTARSLQSQDDKRAALTVLRRAIARVEATEARALEPDLLLDLAFNLAGVGEFPEAESVLHRVQGLLEKKRDARLAGRLWSTWGTLRIYQGDLDGARDDQERALEAAEESGDQALLSASLLNLAQGHLQAHDYARALALLERGLALDPPERTRVITLVSIGICHLELGQLAEAEVRFEEARRLATRMGNAGLEGWAAGELGLVAWKRRDGDAALARFDQAIRACRRQGDSRNERAWLMNKGMVRRDQGRFADALVFYREAERLERGLRGLRPSANLRKHIGQCQAGLGRMAEAEALFDEAVRMAAEGRDTKTLWETERERARLYRGTGRPERARAAYEAALSGIESIRRSLRLESFKADFFESKVEVYAEAIEFVLAGGGPDATRHAFELTERARARAFLDSLAESRARLEDTLPRELVEAEGRLLAEISRLQAAQRRGTEDARTADLLAREERELQALHLRVRNEFPRFRHTRQPEPARLEDVQRSLQGGTVLLAYFLAEPRSHLWVVRSDGIVHHHLPGEAEIEGVVREAYAGFLDASVEPRVQPLGTLLLGPLATGPAPGEVVLVPSGILHAVPFEALPVGGGPPLAEVAATSYLPSASVIAELTGLPSPPAPRLLAVADASFEGGASAARTATIAALRGFGALPHSRREARAVASAFGSGATTLLLGRDAVESRFKAEDLSGYSVIHLATHGWIDPRSSARSGLVLGVETGPDDGLLQFREILRLPLRADLVTLSACQTALGEMVTGEGMVGLFRAFLYAGSSSVVASLWNVNDEASAELMRHFYRELRRGRPKAEALRQARLALRAEPRYRHPYYWAPFVVIGRADDAVELPGWWTPARRGGLLAACVLAAGTAAWFLRRGWRAAARQ